MDRYVSNDVENSKDNKISDETPLINEAILIDYIIT